MGWGSRFRRAIRRPARIVRRTVKHHVKVVRRFVRHPAKVTKKFIRNPAKGLLNKNIRNSRYYKNIARPAIKVGTAAGAAYLTGGGSLLAMGAGAAVSVAGGGLSSKPFNPLRDVVAPAAAGWAVGAVQAAGGIGSVTSGMGMDTVGSGLSLVGKVNNLKHKKRKTARRSSVQQVEPLPVIQPQQGTSKGVNWATVAAGAGAGFLVAGPVGAVVGGAGGAMIKGGK